MDNKPCVSVQSHNYAFDAAPLFWTSAFCKNFIYLFFCCIKAQVTNLKLESEMVSACRMVQNSRRVLSIWTTLHSALFYQYVLESPYNSKADPKEKQHAPLCRNSIEHQDESPSQGSLLPLFPRFPFWEVTRPSRVSSFLKHRSHG